MLPVVEPEERSIALSDVDEMRRERVTGEGEKQENDDTGKNPPHEERASLTVLSLSPDSPRSTAILNAVTSESLEYPSSGPMSSVILDSFGRYF